MESLQNTPKQFWDYYFRNQFIRLRRMNGTYTGQVYEEPARASSPLGLAREFPRKEIKISFAEIREYSYIEDKRFYLISMQSSTVLEDFDAILSKTYPYREPAPFGKQRMSDLFFLLKEHYLWGAAEQPTIRALENTLSRLVESYSKDLIQPIAALAWFLGERRQLSSADALIAVVKNSKYQPLSEKLIHFTAVDAALTALWKVNPKTKFSDLIGLMESANSSGRRKLAALFERLSSTTELLGLDRLRRDYLSPLYWTRLLKILMNQTQSEWNRFDLNALFWEIRYLAALRLPATDRNSLNILAEDEVRTVAEVARSRLEQ